jgi:DNA polymerase III epsilon subunit family exonuclease
MRVYPSLISDSLLVNETIQLLQSFGGSASVMEVCDTVFQIQSAGATLARNLVSDLIQADPRLILNDEMVEFVPLSHESRHLLETNYVVFDLETTGAKCPPCRITEIGAYRIERGQITDEFQTLVNPDCPIPPFIVSLTGITNSMVKHAPRFADVAVDFLDFIGDAVLVAHNAHFDMRFLNHEIGRLFSGYRVANPNLCTVQLSRRLLPHIENHKLHTVAEHFSINIENRHRAAGDAEATAKIFVHFLADLRARGVRDVAAARSFRVFERSAARG